MRHLRVQDGTKIAADIRDLGVSAPRLALVHSLAMDHAFWAPVMEELAGYASIVAIDARGHGQSDKPAGPYQVSLMAQDLSDVIDAIGWKSVVVAGASMGGCVALQFAASHADKVCGLGLIDTTAWYGESALTDWTARAARAETEGLSALVEFQRTRWFSDEFKDRRREVVERCVETFLRNDVSAFSATCKMLGAFDGRPLLSAVKCQATVVVGEEDYAAPPAMAAALHDGVAGSRYVLIPRARHLTPLETPGLVANELRALLSAAANS
jgi:3-oxoadipate enol-lactonase